MRREINKEKIVNLKDMKNIGETFYYNGGILIKKRAIREFRDKAFWLNNYFKWTLGKNNIGETILVPSRK